MLINNISNKSNISIYLKKGDILKWGFDVCDNNSIDYNIYYQIDYLTILLNSSKKNDSYKDVINKCNLKIKN